VLKRAQDREQHALFIFKYVVVPETEDAETLFLQVRVATNVTLPFGVLTSVSFNDQPMLQSDKIGDVPVDRQLTFELVSSEPLRPKNLP
jgi:hypothetical protein